MTSNDVALISIVSKFDEKSARVAAEKAGKTYDKAMRDIGKDTFENELVDQFNKAMKIVTGKLKNVNLSSYNANLLEVLFSDKEIDEKKEKIENFIGTISKINGALKGLPSNSFDNLSTAKLDQIVKQQEKIIENNKKISDERKSLNRSATSTANKNKKTSTIEKDYTIDNKRNAEISKSLNSIISKNKDLNDSEKKNVDTLTRLLSLYDAMTKVTPEEGTKEAIRYSKDLLTVVKEIKETSEKVDLFTNKKASNYVKGVIDKKYLGDNLENVNESYLVSRSKQNYVEKGLEPLTSKQAKLEKNLTEYISNAVQKSLEKITVTTEQVLDKAQKKVETLQDSINSLNSNKTEKPIIDNLVDESEVKSLEDIEDRLYSIYDKDSSEGASNKELKEFISLYQQYEKKMASDSSSGMFDPELKEEYDMIVNTDEAMKKYAESINKVTEEKRELNTVTKSDEVENNTTKQVSEITELEKKLSDLSEKYEKLNNNSNFSDDFNLTENEEFQQLSKEIDNVKQEIDNLKGAISQLTYDTSSFDGFANDLEDRLKSVSDTVSNLTSDIDKLQDTLKTGNIPLDGTNISSGSNPAIEQQNKLQEELKETQQQAENTTQAIENVSSQNQKNDISNSDNSLTDIKGLKHYTDEIFDSFDSNMFGKGIGENRLGKAAYFFDQNDTEFWEDIGEYSKYLTTWSANQVKILDQTMGFTEEEIEHIIKNFYSDVDKDMQEDYKFDFKNMFSDIDLYDFKSRFGIELEDVSKLLGYDAVKSSNGEYAFYNTDKLIRETQVYDQEAQKIIEINNRVSQSVQENSITSKEDSKDAFPDKDISASVESVTNSIKEENNALEQNTQKVKENTQAKEQNANVNFNGYDKRLDSYNGKVDKYNTTISRFKDGGWASDAYVQNVKAVENAVKEYETLLNELKGKDASLVTSDDIAQLDRYEKKIKDTIATVTNMSAAEKGYNFVSAQKELDKIHKLLNENSKMSSEVKAKIQAYYREIESGNPSMSLDKIHGEILKIYNAEVEAGRAGRTFFDTLKNSGFHQIAAQMAGMFGFYDVINVVKEGFNVVRELDTALTEMRKVSDESIQILKDYQKESFNTADAIATTGLQMQNSIADWQRLGYSIEEANELAKNSNIYKNVGDMDISTATEHMVSSVQAWKSEFNDDAVKTSEEVMNRYNKIGNEFAISSADIGEAMETSAAALKAGGNDLNEALGIITAGNIIQQDASTTSSAMKILSLRIRGAKADLESMGESTDDLADSTSKLREEIKGLTGVDIMADEDTFKSTTEIIKEIGAVWNQMSDVSQAATLEKLAGKNRASTVAGLIENYETIDKVIEAASNADNSALDENQKIIESIDGRIQQLSNRVQEFWYNLVNDSVVKNAVSAITAIVEGGTKLVDTFDTLPTLLTAIGAGLSLTGHGENVLRPSF